MQPPQGGQQGGPRNGRAILQNAAHILGISEQRLMQAVGTPPPDFRRAAKTLHISEQRIRQAFRMAQR